MRLVVAAVIVCTTLVGVAPTLDAQATIGAFPTEALGFHFGQSPTEAAAACEGAGHGWAEFDPSIPRASPSWVCDQPPSSIGHSGHVVAGFCGRQSLCHLIFESGRVPRAERRAAYLDLYRALSSHYGPGVESTLEGVFDMGRRWRFGDGAEVIVEGVVGQHRPGFVRIIYMSAEAVRASHEPPARDPRPL